MNLKSFKKATRLIIIIQTGGQIQGVNLPHRDRLKTYRDAPNFGKGIMGPTTFWMLLTAATCGVWMAHVFFYIYYRDHDLL